MSSAASRPGPAPRRLRRFLTWCPPLLVLLTCVQALSRQLGAGLPLSRGVRAYRWFTRDWRAFRRLDHHRRFALDPVNLDPYLTDRTETTPVEPVYFVQDTWFAGRIAQRRPERHVDVGSSAKTMALVAQFIPVTMVDIRPVPLTVPGFTFARGSILALPFADGAVASLSSLCVIEHIGLGRYGDDLDPEGSEKAVAELRRVLAPGGDLYLSVPVDAECQVYFNAHRAFTREYVLELCAGLELVTEQHLYGFDVVPAYDAARGFGTGMYHFRRS